MRSFRPSTKAIGCAAGNSRGVAKSIWLFQRHETSLVSKPHICEGRLCSLSFTRPDGIDFSERPSNGDLSANT